MSKMVTISDKLFKELEKCATVHDMSIDSYTEKLLAEVLLSSEEGMFYKRDKLDALFVVHKYLEERYGIVVDSTDMIRGDRDYLLP